MTSSLHTICAFDIGIKNLSYCVLDDGSITEWELIDLRTSHLTCNCQLRGGKSCGKPAIFVSPIDAEKLYCSKHSKQYIPPEFISNKCDIKKCEFISARTQHKCGKKGTNAIDNTVYCDKHIEKIKTQKSALCRVKNIGCMKEPLYELGKHLYEILDTKPEILKTKKIVIENQPSLTNPTMKSISIILLSYFIMKKHPNVEFVAPSGKLKVYSQLTKDVLSVCTKSNKYKVTKELGVKYCGEILKSFHNGNKWFEFMSVSKKKDDLCDAFLHAYYHSYGEISQIPDNFASEIVLFFTKKTTQNGKVVKLDI